MAWTRTDIGGTTSTSDVAPITASVLNATATTNQINLDSDAANVGTISMETLTADRTWTLPDATDTLVGKATTDTLTNKTLTAPTIQGTVGAGTGLTLPSFDLGAADTTISRSAAGVIAVEGVDQASISGAQTLTNKTLSGAVVSGAAPATPVANTLYADSIVKGWLETSGSGAWTIDDDLNVSSITDNGVGDLTINWATAFANANYAVVGVPINATTVSHLVQESTATAKATTAVRIEVMDAAAAAGTNVDPGTGICVIAIGDM